jgi:hypothetical protein
MPNQFHFCNSQPKSNNNLGRTTRVATNLRSYFIPVHRNNTHNDSQPHQTGTTMGLPPLATGILVVGVIGPTLKQLAGSGRNRHNLIPARYPSVHAYAHILLS